MDEIEAVLLAGWERVWPLLKADPRELRRRLLRRRGKEFRRPVRALCLGIRASDTRLEEVMGRKVFTGNGRALTGRELVRERRRMMESGELPEREVVGIGGEMLKRLAAGVQFDGPVRVSEAAERLGVTEASIRRAATKGVFEVTARGSGVGRVAWGGRDKKGTEREGTEALRH